MYRIGENHIKRRHRHAAMLVAAGLALIGGGIWVAHSLQTTTVIAPSPPATTGEVTIPKVPTVHIDEPLFSIDLPADWKLKQHATDGANVYTWINTTDNPGVRSLSLYVDTAEPALGVNRALAVQSNGNRLTVVGDVSDNCASFTAPGAGTPNDAVPAKWNGANFLCDLANYGRNVVGTVSADGVNKTVLAGDSTGTHAVFFAYTDATAQPDYTIFVNALQSFRLK